MPSALFQTHGTFSRGKKTASGGTAFAQFIPPLRNQYGAPLGSSGVPSSPILNGGVTHVTDLFYQIGTAAHVLTIMRPLNYTTFSAAAAASQAVVNITADPGLFQTAGRYLYPLPNGQTVPSPGNNGIATNDYVVYQAACGQWVMDTVSSVSSLAVTLNTNLPTGGVLAGGLLYWFGISTDTDPATNEAHEQFDLLAAGSGTVMNTYQNQNGLWSTFHAGDPLVLYSNNASTQGYIEKIAGFYSKH